MPRLIKEQRPSVGDPTAPPIRVVLLRGIHTFRVTVQPRGVRDWLPTWTAEAGRRFEDDVALGQRRAFPGDFSGYVVLLGTGFTATAKHQRQEDDEAKGELHVMH